MKIHPQQFVEIKREAHALREMMGDEFDPEFFADTLDGETDVMDIIGGVLQAIAETEAMEAKNKSLASLYALRAKVLNERRDAMRGVIARIMDCMGEKTVRHAFATLSLRAGKENPVITDTDKIPAELGDITWKPSLKAIRETDYHGDGVTWSNAGPVLTIRRS